METSKKRTMEQTESQFARVKNTLASRTYRPSIGLGSLSNMGGKNGIIANRYAKAIRGYMKRKYDSNDCLAQ